MLDALLQHTDAGVATSDDAVVIFDDVAVLMPRGRFEVEMHVGFLKMVGQVIWGRPNKSMQHHSLEGCEFVK